MAEQVKIVNFGLGRRRFKLLSDEVRSVDIGLIIEEILVLSGEGKALSLSRAQSLVNIAEKLFSQLEFHAL